MKTLLRLHLSFIGAVFVGSASLYSQTTYTFIDPNSLPPIVAGGTLSAWNNLDHYSYYNTTSTDTQLYLYNAGSVTLVPERGGLTHLTGARLNDNNQILGRGRDASGISHDFIYDPNADTFSVHDFLANGENYILGFNNLGQVSVGDNTGTQYIKRVFDGDTVYLSPDGGGGRGLNNAGDVLLSDGRIWNVRSGEISNTLPLSGPGENFGDNDWFVYSTPFQLYRANLTPGHIQPFEQVGSWRYQVFAYSINGSGVSVGSLWDDKAEPSRGFVSFGPGGLFDLSNLVLGLDGDVVKGASSINNRGEIVAFIGNPAGFDSREVILVPTGSIPVPEPSTYSALGVVLLGCAGGLRARRRSRKSSTDPKS